MWPRVSQLLLSICAGITEPVRPESQGPRMPTAVVRGLTRVRGKLPEGFRDKRWLPRCGERGSGWEDGVEANCQEHVGKASGVVSEEVWEGKCMFTNTLGTATTSNSCRAPGAMLGSYCFEDDDEARAQGWAHGVSKKHHMQEGGCGEHGR